MFIFKKDTLSTFASSNKVHDHISVYLYSFSGFGKKSLQHNKLQMKYDKCHGK